MQLPFPAPLRDDEIPHSTVASGHPVCIKCSNCDREARAPMLAKCRGTYNVITGTSNKSCLSTRSDPSLCGITGKWFKPIEEEEPIEEPKPKRWWFF